MQKRSIIRRLGQVLDLPSRIPAKDSRSLHFARKYSAKTGKLIRKGVKALGKEADETEQMARSFFRVLEARLDLNNRTAPPSEEEVKAAIEQLKDVGRFSLFATMVILPGGVVSLVGLELLARKFGVNFSLIPSSFRKEQQQGNTGNIEKIRNSSRGH